MTMQVNLLKPRLMQWNGVGITDHNRSELTMTVEQIETAKRMANGRMRKYHVADKRTFSTSWTMLPNATQFTVDGHAGADWIEAFYLNNRGEVTLTLSFGNAPEKTYTVMFTDFSKKLNKRGKFDFYDVDITMEEV